MYDRTLDWTQLIDVRMHHTVLSNTIFIMTTLSKYINYLNYLNTDSTFYFNWSNRTFTLTENCRGNRYKHIWYSDLLINKLQGLKNNIKYLPIHRIFVLLLAFFYKYIQKMIEKKVLQYFKINTIVHMQLLIFVMFLWKTKVTFSFLYGILYTYFFMYIAVVHTIWNSHYPETFNRNVIAYKSLKSYLYVFWIFNIFNNNYI